MSILNPTILIDLPDTPRNSHLYTYPITPDQLKTLWKRFAATPTKTPQEQAIYIQLKHYFKED